MVLTVDGDGGYVSSIWRQWKIFINLIYTPSVRFSPFLLIQGFWFFGWKVEANLNAKSLTKLVSLSPKKKRIVKSFWNRFIVTNNQWSLMELGKRWLEGERVIILIMLIGVRSFGGVTMGDPSKKRREKVVNTHEESALQAPTRGSVCLNEPYLHIIVKLSL